VVGGWGGAEPNPTKPPTATKPAAAIITMTMAATAKVDYEKANVQIRIPAQQAEGKKQGAKDTSEG
jgi:hypothetical protein